MRAKDVDAFVGLYADDVRTFDLWSVWSYDGKDALRGTVAEWFGSLADDEVVEVGFDEVRTQVGEDVAAVSAFTTFRAVSQEGEEMRSMNNRLTWILRKNPDGAWPESAKATVCRARARDWAVPAASKGSVAARPPHQPLCQMV